MNIKEEYISLPIPKHEAKPWLLEKHYAKRVPLIDLCFGLYPNKERNLSGIITFSPPARMLNNGGCFNGYSVKVEELSRLCVIDGLPKNVLSFFVMDSIKQLPKPMCIVSYADPNVGHHGYIYQATNWVYTGLSSRENHFIDINTNKQVHRRTLNSYYGSSSKKAGILPDNYACVAEPLGKHRYFLFLGNKRDKQTMKRLLKFPILPYPKGNNERYDSSFCPKTQGFLF